MSSDEIKNKKNVIVDTEESNGDGDKNKLKSIVEDRAQGYLFKLQINKSRMNLFMTYAAKDPEKIMPFSDVMDVLQENKIVYGIKKDVIENLLDEMKSSGGGVQNICIAEGDPVEHGKDGCLRYHCRPTRKKPNYSKDNDGNIDYHSANMFQNIQKGDLLAEMELPTEGVPGKTIFGETVMPKSGKPLKVLVKENVRVKEGEKIKYYAEADGHLLVKGVSISVPETYLINGNVDYSTGDIDFIGNLEIHGDVVDEFKIKAQKNICVFGTIEAAYVEAGGDLTVRRGIAGKERARIKVSGTVEANFIDEAWLEAEGDVLAEKEIINSRVNTLGAVTVKNGSIIGGEITALGGIHTHDLGSDLGVKTFLYAGIDYTLKDNLIAINRNIVRIENRNEQICQKLGQMLEMALEKNKTGNRVMCALKEGVEMLKYGMKKLGVLEPKRDEILDQYHLPPVEEVRVMNLVFPGSVVAIGKYEREIHDSLIGPLLFYEDFERSAVAFEATTEKNLSKKEKEEPHMEEESERQP